VGLAALGAVHLMLATPWPLDPVFAGRAVQLDFLLVWGGFAALVAGLEMIVAGLWGVPWRRRASLAPETSNPSNGEA
jgi:hypothetical protein